jgi:hypothetical protein
MAHLCKGDTFAKSPPVSGSAPPPPGGYVNETVARLLIAPQVAAPWTTRNEQITRT